MKIIEVKSSSQRDDYEGTPYTEFKVSNQNGIAYIKLYGKDQNSSEKAIDVRKKVFKEFLIATGAESFNNVSAAIKETIGKEINVCLAEREYWTYDKHTGEPIIKQVIAFKFATPVSENATWNEKYNKKLSTTDRELYHEAQKSFMGKKPTSDIPF